ncbi:Protein YIPF6 [Thelohanellus kitauei]|uniref:Protein YIPF n=1 Tax=Thelohanellus kitauei TaxID=669202 RepID=A0A0C2NMA7_THEKT|nr:Protein YIPF6 [Thelohanellus kitauei]
MDSEETLLGFTDLKDSSIPIDDPVHLQTGDQPEIPSTLDEPVYTTILRDLNAILSKVISVVLFRQNSRAMAEWDLWGPMIIYILFSFLVTPYGVRTDDFSASFTRYLTYLWLSSLFITVHSNILSRKISIFHFLCLIGYCTIPISAAALLSAILDLMSSNVFATVIKIALVIGGMGWSISASYLYLRTLHPLEKTVMIGYPIFLFFLTSGWFILYMGI